MPGQFICTAPMPVENKRPILRGCMREDHQLFLIWATTTLASAPSFANPYAPFPTEGIYCVPVALLQIVVMVSLTVIAGGYEIVRAGGTLGKRRYLYAGLILFSCWIPFASCPFMMFIILDRALQFLVWVYQAKNSSPPPAYLEGVRPQRLRVCAVVLILSLPVFLVLWIMSFAFEANRDLIWRDLEVPGEQNKASMGPSWEADKTPGAQCCQILNYQVVHAQKSEYVDSIPTGQSTRTCHFRVDASEPRSYCLGEWC
jgi:hypothetical protein